MPLVDDMGNLMGLCWWNMASASVGSWKTAIYCTLGAHAVGTLVGRMGLDSTPSGSSLPFLFFSLNMQNCWHESEKTHYGAEGMRWHPCVLVYVCVSVSMLCPGVCVSVSMCERNPNPITHTGLGVLTTHCPCSCSFFSWWHIRVDTNIASMDQWCATLTPIMHR